MSLSFLLALGLLGSVSVAEVPIAKPCECGAIRVQSRNLGYSTNSILNLEDQAKLDRLIEVVRNDRLTDLFLFQEISPAVGDRLREQLGESHEIVLDAGPDGIDVALLLRRNGERASFSLVGRPDRYQSTSSAWIDHSDTTSYYGWIGVRMAHPDGEFALASVHIVASFKPGSDQEALASLEALESYVDRNLAEGRPVLIGGDFNIDPTRSNAELESVQHFRALRARAGLLHYPSRPSFQIWKYKRDFDHLMVFLPDGWEGVRGNGWYSTEGVFDQAIPKTDHRGIRALFAVHPAIDESALSCLH